MLVSMADYIVYLLFRGSALIFSMLPFSWVYALSDFCYFLGYTIARYRVKVVSGNLQKAFPEKTEAERKQIMKGFYHHLFDVLVESLKSYSMREEEVAKRFVIAPSETLQNAYRENRNVICVAGHYGNWEWAGIAAGSQIPHVPVGFYKPLSNKYIDAYMQRTRVKGRSRLVSIENTAAVFATDFGEPALFYMIADQSPPTARLAYWMEFLHQDTAVLFGPERYARNLNLPVVYADIRKVKRGYYQVKFIPVTTDPSKEKRGEISISFMKKLEESIIENPQYYLWSHRRWKLKREKIAGPQGSQGSANTDISS
jgi:Kdo2-lipid IVA lauroyltransferase/acyltransferase